jgi:toxin ParE1/3/4
MSLGAFPNRGRRRDDILSGLRLLVLRRRVSIAYLVRPDAVVVVGVFHAGRDIRAALSTRSS